MESKSFVKLLRRVIREEVRSAVKEILTEQTVDHKKVISHGMELSEIANNPKRKKKSYSKNSMLNDILNETAGLPSEGPLVSQTSFPSMNYKSEMAESFGMSQQPQALATTDVHGKPVNMQNKAVAKTVDIMTKDYSGVMAAMKKMDKSKGKKVV
jgi:hypothetical protein